MEGVFDGHVCVVSIRTHTHTHTHIPSLDLPPKPPPPLNQSKHKHQDTSNRVLVLERWGGGLVRGDGWGLRTLTTGTALYVEGSVRKQSLTFFLFLLSVPKVLRVSF